MKKFIAICAAMKLAYLCSTHKHKAELLFGIQSTTDKSAIL